MFLPKLTFGFWDQVIRNRPVSNAVVRVEGATKDNNGEPLLLLSDGGTSLRNTDNSLYRYTLACILRTRVNRTLQVGDVIQLTSYRILTNKKGTPIVAIESMQFLGNEKLAASQFIRPYPHTQARECVMSVMQHREERQVGPRSYKLLSNEQMIPSNAPTTFGQSRNSLSSFRRGQSDSQQQAPGTSAYAPQYRAHTGQPVPHRVDSQFVAVKNLSSDQDQWVVKGRFVNLGEPRPYKNKKGESNFWNVNLMDSLDEKGTIWCTFFNKAVDIFHPLIRENEVYTVSKGTITQANRKFNNGAHEFQMHLEEDAEIKWMADDPTIPKKRLLPPVLISSLKDLLERMVVSVSGCLIDWHATIGSMDPAEPMSLSLETPQPYMPAVPAASKIPPQQQQPSHLGAQQQVTSNNYHSTMPMRPSAAVGQFITPMRPRDS